MMSNPISLANNESWLNKCSFRVPVSGIEEVIELYSLIKRRTQLRLPTVQICLLLTMSAGIFVGCASTDVTSLPPELQTGVPPIHSVQLRSLGSHSLERSLGQPVEGRRLPSFY